jgi:hypothetical protein
MALHGTANTIDSLAYELHRLAKRIRALHSKRTALVSERWVREIEG